MKGIITAICGHFREKKYYYVAALITAVLLAMALFCFPNFVGRLIESGRDLGLSFATLFCDLFDIETDITYTVSELPDYGFLNIHGWLSSIAGKPFTPTMPYDHLPLDWETFCIRWKEYWTAFFDKQNFELYLYSVLYFLSQMAPLIMFLIPIWLAVKKLFKKYYFRERRKTETEEEQAEEARPLEESKPLRHWHKLYFNKLLRIKIWFVGLFAFVKERKLLWQVWLVLLLFYFNGFTILLETVAYYIYFAMEFDLPSLYRYVCKVVLDLHPLLSFVGAVSWITVLCFALNGSVENLMLGEE